MNYTRQGYVGEAHATRADEAKIMSIAPLTFTSSLWNRSSSSTFFRNRTKSASIKGDCPSTGAYMSIMGGKSE